MNLIKLNLIFFHVGMKWIKKWELIFGFPPSLLETFCDMFRFKDYILWLRHDDIFTICKENTIRFILEFALVNTIDFQWKSSKRTDYFKSELFYEIFSITLQPNVSRCAICIWVKFSALLTLSELDTWWVWPDLN